MLCALTPASVMGLATLTSLCLAPGGAMILDGKGISAAWKREVAAEVAEVTAQAGRPPGLAVVLVGGRPDSKIYVHRKQEACQKVGVLHAYVETVPHRFTNVVTRECSTGLLYHD